MILTIPRAQLLAHPESGCWIPESLNFLQPPRWQPRADVEHDERYLQPIVYLVLMNTDGQAWFYQRQGGDERLDGRWSCGVGGHVDASDALPDACFDPAATLERALLREAHEELNITLADLPRLQLRGLIFESLSAVGRVHVGVLYSAHWPHAREPQPRADEKLMGQGFMDLNGIADNPQFELWSRLAAKFLQESA